MTPLPQVLVNVRVAERRPDVAERLADEIAAVEAELGDTGRILVRPSGTEPLVRVMVEAPTPTRPSRSPTRSPRSPAASPPDQRSCLGWADAGAPRTGTGAAVA